MLRTIRNFVIALTLTVAATLGLAVVSSAPAHAATSAGFCMKWSTGTVYNSQPVHLMQWNGRTWVATKQGKTAANGCGTFTGLSANAHYLVRGHAVLPVGSHRQVWSGDTPYYTSTGAGRAELGTGVVRHVYNA